MPHARARHQPLTAWKPTRKLPSAMGIKIQNDQFFKNPKIARARNIRAIKALKIRPLVSMFDFIILNLLNCVFHAIANRDRERLQANLEIQM